MNRSLDRIETGNEISDLSQDHVTEWRIHRLFISEGTGLATYIFLWVKGLWESGRANSP